MTENPYLSVSIILLSFVLALVLTGFVKRALLQRAVLDIPNDRSSHKIPVPRGGGWALVGLLLPAMIGATFFYDHSLRHVGLIGAVFVLAGISWLDDRSHVNPLVRLALHLFAAWLGSLSFSSQELLFGGALPFWLDRALMILGWAWFINLYNFMDGIDGITGIETLCIANGVSFAFTVASIDLPFVDFLTLILTGLSLGFLAHNWHPAKIFLGDIGSVPLGYLAGFCLLSLAVKGYLVAALILPLYYIADSGITLTRRALRHEKIWQAHREHFYQQAALGAGRHDKVVWLITTANLGLILAACIALSHPLEGGLCAILIVALLLRKMHKTGAQRVQKL